MRTYIHIKCVFVFFINLYLHINFTQGAYKYKLNLLRAQGHTEMHTYTYNVVHTYIHTYTHTYIHTHIRTCINTYTYIHTYIHSYIHTYIRTYTCMSAGACTGHYFRRISIARCNRRSCRMYLGLHGF